MSFPPLYRLRPRTDKPLGAVETIQPRAGWQGKALREDTTIPRISVACDVDHCLIGITWVKNRGEYDVWQAVDESIEWVDWDGPRDHVPDWDVSEEVWLRTPTQFVLIGRIEVDERAWMDVGQPAWKWTAGPHKGA